MLTRKELQELAEHGICFTWSENLNKKGYSRGFGFFPLTKQVNEEQHLFQEDYPELTQQQVDEKVKSKFGYFVYDPILGEVHKKVQRIISDTVVKINDNIVSIPQVAPVENHADEMSIAATHGIIDNNVYRIQERGSHSFKLSNGKNYFKDNSLNKVPVVWVRMIATNYDNIKYSTW